MIIKISRNQFRDAIEAGIASAIEASRNHGEPTLSNEYFDRLRSLVEETEFVGATFTSHDPEFGICARCPVGQVEDKYGCAWDACADSGVWDFIDGYDRALQDFLYLGDGESADIVFRIYD